jgi:hypothetical protein
VTEGIEVGGSEVDVGRATVGGSVTVAITEGLGEGSRVETGEAVGESWSVGVGVGSSRSGFSVAPGGGANGFSGVPDVSPGTAGVTVGILIGGGKSGGRICTGRPEVVVGVRVGVGDKVGVRVARGVTMMASRTNSSSGWVSKIATTVLRISTVGICRKVQASVKSKIQETKPIRSRRVIISSSLL